MGHVSKRKNIDQGMGSKQNKRTRSKNTGRKAQLGLSVLKLPICGVSICPYVGSASALFHR